MKRDTTKLSGTSTLDQTCLTNLMEVANIFANDLKQLKSIVGIGPLLSIDVKWLPPLWKPIKIENTLKHFKAFLDTFVSEDCFRRFHHQRTPVQAFLFFV